MGTRHMLLLLIGFSILCCTTAGTVTSESLVINEALYPEGIAYDTTTQKIYLSSLGNPVILQVDGATRGGVLNYDTVVNTTFPGDGRCFGGHVDNVMGRVYFAVGSFSAEGFSAVVGYNLTTFDEVFRAEFPCDTTTSYCGAGNDVITNADGSFVYVTDTKRGLVWEVNADTEESRLVSNGTELLPPDLNGFGANGIDIDPSEQYLYVSNYDFLTLLRVEISTGVINEVILEDVTLEAGIDGIRFLPDDRLVLQTSPEAFLVECADSSCLTMRKDDQVDLRAYVGATTVAIADDPLSILITMADLARLFGPDPDRFEWTNFTVVEAQFRAAVSPSASPSVSVSPSASPSVSVSPSLTPTPTPSPQLACSDFHREDDCISHTMPCYFKVTTIWSDISYPDENSVRGACFDCIQGSSNRYLTDQQFINLTCQVAGGDSIRYDLVMSDTILNPECGEGTIGASTGLLDCNDTSSAQDAQDLEYHTTVTLQFTGVSLRHWFDYEGALLDGLEEKFGYPVNYGLAVQDSNDDLDVELFVITTTFDDAFTLVNGRLLNTTDLETTITYLMELDEDQSVSAVVDPDNAVSYTSPIEVNFASLSEPSMFLSLLTSLTLLKFM